jgi:hypothetical protein
VIISDLQHIESATETEVQGGCKKCWRPSGGQKPKPPAISCDPPYYNTAVAEAGAQAFGTNTITSTTTDTLVIQ